MLSKSILFFPLFIMLISTCSNMLPSGENKCEADCQNSNDIIQVNHRISKSNLHKTHCRDSMTYDEFWNYLNKYYDVNRDSYNSYDLEAISSGKIDSCIIVFKFSDNRERLEFIFSKKGCYMGYGGRRIRTSAGRSAPLVAIDIPLAKNILKRLEDIYINKKYPIKNSESQDFIIDKLSSSGLMDIYIYSEGKWIADMLYVGDLQLTGDDAYDYSYHLSKVIELIRNLTREYVRKIDDKEDWFIIDKNEFILLISAK